MHDPTGYARAGHTETVAGQVQRDRSPVQTDHIRKFATTSPADVALGNRHLDQTAGGRRVRTPRALPLQRNSSAITLLQGRARVRSSAHASSPKAT